MSYRLVIWQRLESSVCKIAYIENSKFLTCLCFYPQTGQCCRVSRKASFWDRTAKHTTDNPVPQKTSNHKIIPSPHRNSQNQQRKQRSSLLLAPEGQMKGSQCFMIWKTPAHVASGMLTMQEYWVFCLFLVFFLIPYHTTHIIQHSKNPASKNCRFTEPLKKSTSSCHSLIPWLHHKRISWHTFAYSP